MVRHQKGHKNSKGEVAEWVIVSHKDGHIISSHKSKAEAEKHLKDIRKFKHMKEAMNLEEAKKILLDEGYVYLDTDRELKRKEVFKKRLDTYKEKLKDLNYALKQTNEGLSAILMNEMEEYIADETKFILKMAKDLVKKIEKDFLSDIK